MNQTRGLLYILLVVFTFFGIQAWLGDKEAANAPKPTLSQQHNQVVDTTKNIKLSNDVLTLTVNTQSGYFVGADLKNYPRTINSETPLNLLNTNLEAAPADGYLEIRSGLTGPQGTFTNNTAENFTPVAQTRNSVTLKEVRGGTTYLKTISLEPNSYVVNVKYEVSNANSQSISLAPYAVFKIIPAPTPSLFSSSNIYGTNSSYQGVITSTDEDNYDKTSFENLQELPLTTKSGWVAYSQHFFVTAYVPGQVEVQSTNEVNLAKANDNFTISAQEKTAGNKFDYLNVTNSLVTVEPGKTQVFTDKFWIGPKIQKELEAVAPDLSLVVDYGWAWFLSEPLYYLLTFLQSFIGNWGLAIIALTIVVRLIIFPLSRIQFRNAALMRCLQPELQAAAERAGGDSMKRMQETQRVFAKYGASQFAGCLPALITAPIFLALFYLINEAVELRHQAFFGWIQDLSQADPFFILPVINGAVMIYMFKLTPQPATMDPMQKKIMNMMPYIFMIFFLFLPSGLILYYIISNLITICMIKYWNKKIREQFDNKTLPTYNASGRQKNAKAK